MMKRIGIFYVGVILYLKFRVIFLGEGDDVWEIWKRFWCLSLIKFFEIEAIRDVGEVGSGREVVAVREEGKVFGGTVEG